MNDTKKKAAIRALEIGLPRTREIVASAQQIKSQVLTEDSLQKTKRKSGYPHTISKPDANSGASKNAEKSDKK